MTNVITILRDTKRLTASERAVASVILRHPDEALSASIYDLARRANTSPATITRLCKKCRCANYQELKIEIAKWRSYLLNQGKDIDPNIPFKPADPAITIAEKIAQLSTETIAATNQMLDGEQLNRVVKMLKDARTIYGIGISGNFIRLRDFQLKLLKIKQYVQLVDLQAEQYYLAYHGNKNDIALIVSYSGRTAEIVNDARLFRENHTRIIAITADPDSPLATYAQEVLLIPMSETAEIKVSDFSSQIAIEYLLNTLYSCLFNQNFDQNYHDQTTTPIAHF